MKHHCTWGQEIMVACAIVALTTPDTVLAQEKSQVVISDAAQQKPVKLTSLNVGATVSYKTFTSKKFLKARILAISESTISLSRKNDGDTTIFKKDLAELKVHSKDKRLAGTTIIALGTASVLVGMLAQGVAGSHAGSGHTDPGATAATASGIVAIATGIILQQPKKIDLDKPWQPTSAKSQKESDALFNVGLGVGFANTLDGSSARILSLEPSYRFRPDATFGLRIEGLLPTGERTNLKGGTFTLNGQYYLTANKFRPFVGGGLGVFAFGNPILGFYPRAGFTFGRLFLIVDYNIISTSSSTPTFVSPTSSQVTGQPVTYYTPVASPANDLIKKYLGIRISFNLRK